MNLLRAVAILLACAAASSAGEKEPRKIRKRWVAASGKEEAARFAGYAYLPSAGDARRRCPSASHQVAIGSREVP